MKSFQKFTPSEPTQAERAGADIWLGQGRGMGGSALRKELDMRVRNAGDLKGVRKRENDDAIARIRQRLQEDVTPDTTITVTARDPEGTLRKLLDCIRKSGNGGHSFSIIVDPDESRGLSERKFFWDGDGSDHIFEIK